MAVSADLYGNAILNAFLGKINVTADAMKGMLCTSSYTPNLGSDAFKSSVTAEVVGTGYTAGGQALTAVTATFTAANSWATVAAVSTAYNVGQIVRPATGNGYLYRVVVAGTSGTTAPAWSTVVGQNTTDGTVQWDNVGFGLVKLDCNDLTWANSTITARYLVIYDSTPATAATQPLVGVVNFGADVVSTNGTFSVTFDALGFAVFAPA